MKIALTGASGYVGSRIATCLRAHDHEVLSLSRRPCPEPWLSYSLCDDPSQLPWAGVDALIHAAHDFTPQNWQENVRCNINPAIALFDSAKAAGVGRLMFISSMSCFDGCRSLYGKSKLAVEKRVLELGGQVIRPGLVWGGKPGGVMGALESLVRTLPVVPYLAGSRDLRQFLIHEEDLAEGTHAIISATPATTGIHSLMNPDSLSMRDILSTISRRHNLHRFFIPCHWILAMIPIRIAETLGLKIPFRSDSLIGLVHGNTHPDFNPAPFGISYRAFQ